MTSEKWDKHYCKIEKEIAGKSKEKPITRRVGAVLVRDNRIIATGFNGLPTGVTDTPEQLQNKAIQQDMVVHAEMNALAVAGERVKGATVYVYGKPVCARCAASLIQAGISRVISPKPLTELEVLAKRKIAMENDPEATPAHEEEGFVDWEKSGRTARECLRRQILLSTLTIESHLKFKKKSIRT